MNVILKLFIVPFAAYVATLFSVGFLSSIIGKRELIEFLGSKNVMPIWLSWCMIFSIGIIIHWMYKKWQ